MNHFKLNFCLTPLLFLFNSFPFWDLISWVTLHFGITAHLCPWQGSVPILPPNSLKTLHRERLTSVIGICRLMPCQNCNRSSCFSKGGTVDTVKLARLDVSWNITLKQLCVDRTRRCRFMWRKHPNFDETGITLIRSLWPNDVPPHLDAVYQNVQRNVILFFKGKVNSLKSSELRVIMFLNTIYLKVTTKKYSYKFFTSDLNLYQIDIYFVSLLLQGSSTGCWSSWK